jgi:hypothetical protein
LTEWVRVPRGSRTWFERDSRAGDAPGAGAWNRGSIRTVPVKYSTGSFIEAQRTVDERTI